jgi:integrase/recombinase XerC
MYVQLYALQEHGLDFGLNPDDGFEELRNRVIEKKQNCPMFWSLDGKPVCTNRVRDIINDVAKKAGLNYHITPHMFRHSFATHVLDMGVTDPLALRDVLGHESLSMIDYYNKVSKHRRFNRVNAFHPRQLGAVPTEG